MADPQKAMGAIAPRKTARRIFLNVSENKSSDRKLSLIPFVSAACFEDILTPEIGTGINGMPDPLPPQLDLLDPPLFTNELHKAIPKNSQRN